MFNGFCTQNTEMRHNSWNEKGYGFYVWKLFAAIYCYMFMEYVCMIQFLFRIKYFINRFTRLVEINVKCMQEMGWSLNMYIRQCIHIYDLKRCICMY